ncbi:Spc98 family-domain-containing protein [Phascolomyces articulosus]|uniref:Spc98 family-domain-containing protein n=1 Tax=Phascolomyces articulosus TaxID=60185 RepID=A0AAD5KGD6_9FUNG|nr:Spc98 family-domain-containing protein [Phascolomyces articulosus]
MSIPDSLRTFLQENRNQQSHQYSVGESSRIARLSTTSSYHNLSENLTTTTNNYNHSNNNSNNNSSSTSILDRHTAKTLQKLVQRFIQSDPDNPQDQVHYDVTYDKCARLLASQPSPSVLEDENHVANMIRRKLTRDPQDMTNAARFGHLYNKLTSQPVLRNKWSILYLLTLVSSVDDPSSAPLSPTGGSPLGLSSVSPQLQPVNSRPYDMQHESTPSRNTRRRLADDYLESDQMLPPAVQLEKAREAFQNSVSNSGYEPVVPESALLRDLIFIFQGIDGQYIKYDSHNQEYVMDSQANVPQPTKDLVYRLTEIGWLYQRIQTFIRPRCNDPSAGLVAQAFCFALQHELTDYYKLIAVLEAQIEKQASNTTAVPNEHTLTLRRLLLWTRESSQRLRLMSVLVDVCKDQKGGALVSTMHNYTKHGDPFIQKYIKAMLEEVSKPFYEMLQRWIYEGELDDPYQEFFVACDPSVSEEELWQSKYTIRENMIPSFISSELAQKIFLIGKSLNFIRYSCQDDTFSVRNHDSSNPSLPTFKYGDILAAERSIDLTYRETSKQLIDLLKHKYKLMDHLRALKRYLLLGQGDFIQYLMGTLGPGLNRPAKTLFRHNLTGVLETAIRASNAQYDDPEILNRLDVRLLEVSSNDLGWDVFTLDYHLDSPINTVFNPPAMHQYLRMFNFLWQLKRVEYTLTASWRRWSMASRDFVSVPEMAQDLHQAQLCISRMVHFIYQLQHYYLFEVLECSWEKLDDYINNKCIDLDSIIEAHSQYLSEITQKGFLSGVKNQALSMRLNSLFEIILTYKSVLDNLYAFGSSSHRDLEKLKRIRTKHKDMEKKFQTQVLEFVDVLASYHDEDLRSLLTRLNYSGYYSSN